MRIYKLTSGVLIDHNNQYYTVPIADWDNLINDDAIFLKLTDFLESGKATKINSIQEADILAPIGSQQELWACGVTYWRSKVGRQEESKLSGGADFYAKVYEAERPEVFFKATPNRIVGHNQKVKIRKDSTWDVPEPELTLVVTSSGKIIGYTIGNDMSSRSIEGENPLYLPQAKTYDQCAALGPCILITDTPLDKNSLISLDIIRQENKVFEGTVTLDQMKRTPEELVSYVYRECSFPSGCLIMTGTGIVPPNDFTLKSGDEIRIRIEGIGELINSVV
jgi:2-dehydro-3-deoxy-D-arabinonate dehydratase